MRMSTVRASRTIRTGASAICRDNDEKYILSSTYVLYRRLHGKMNDNSARSRVETLAHLSTRTSMGISESE